MLPHRAVGLGRSGGGAISRRDLLKAGAYAAAVAAPAASTMLSRRARAQQKTLKVLQFKHFVPSFDQWFNETYVRQWGEQNDTRVIVDYVGLADIGGQAKAEIEAKRGHDLVIFLSPAGIYEDQVIDHREIYEESERRYGKARDFAVRSTYNPKTKKYFASSRLSTVGDHLPQRPLGRGGSSARQLVRYPDGRAPDQTGGREAGRLQPGAGRQQQLHHAHDHVLLRSFGAGRGRQSALKSKPALEALRYVKALYDEAMLKDVLSWDAASNNRFMLNGEGCLTLDTVPLRGPVRT